MVETVITFLSENWQLLTGCLILGSCTGVLTGLFGAGGGFIVTPALNIILGLPYNFAVGISSCQILGASSFALYQHFDRRMLGLRIALFTGIGIPAGSFAGVFVGEHLKGMGIVNIAGKAVKSQDFYFTLFFCVLLSLVALWMFFDNFYLSRGRSDNDAHKGYLAWLKAPPLFRFRTVSHGPFSIPVLVVLGIVIGFLSGLLGIGGGVIMMPMLFYLIGQDTKYAAQTSTYLLFASCLFATIFHAREGNIKYIPVVMLLFGAFFGARIGVVLQRKFTGGSIRKYFAFVVLAAVLMVIYKLHLILAKAPPF